MKKGAMIGIGLSILVLAIIVGIASLPDEVLIENPSLETSETLPTNEEQIKVPVAEEPVETVAEEPVETVAEEPVETVAEEPVETETEDKTSEDNVIRVEIKDGIGSGDK
jgi:outer membrane biosynthesis protein TonB